jgi:hypothetical protein
MVEERKGVHAGKSGTWQKRKKKEKKGQSLENSMPGMGSGVQIVQYSCIVVST